FFSSRRRHTRWPRDWSSDVCSSDLSSTSKCSRSSSSMAVAASSAMELLEREHFDVLLTDFRLPNEDGMKLIARAKSLPKPPVCILMTAYGSEELAVEAMKSGADDYIAKGRLQIEELEMRIGRVLRQQNLEAENQALRQQLDHKFGLE